MTTLQADINPLQQRVLLQRNKELKESSSSGEEVISPPKHKNLKPKDQPRPSQPEYDEDDLVIMQMEKNLGLTGKKGYLIGDGLDEILYGDEEERTALRHKLKSKYVASPLDKDFGGDISLPEDSSSEGGEQEESEVEQSSGEPDEDDLVIMEMEKKLGLSGKKVYLIGDGLDEILYGDEEERDRLRRKLKSKYIPVPLDKDYGRSDSPVQSSEVSDEEAESFEGDEDSFEEMEDSQEGDSGQSESGDEEESDQNIETHPPTEVQNQAKQKPGVYIPPALRAKQSSNEQLTRQIRSFINKISEGNLIHHLELIEQLYSQHPSNDVNEQLGDSILSLCTEENLLVHLLIPIYACLLAAVHGIRGPQVGGTFLEGFGTRFNESWESKKVESSRNLFSLLIHLYNLEIVHSELMFDLTKLFINRLQELDVELILLLLTNCGSKLREDDPGALKEIIKQVFEKTNNSKLSPGSRQQFMLDTIINLKNNKLKQTSTTELDNLKRIKRLVLNYLKKRDVSEFDILKISWDDLVRGDKKSRKWMVGSAYAAPSEREMDEKREQMRALSNTVTDKMTKVAQNHRMNTDLKKNVFSILLTSEDYLDAFQKLMALRIKDKQDKDVVFVLFYCCKREKEFNPFYAFLAEKLCSVNQNFKFTFKVSFWDELKLIDEDEIKPTEQKNLCRLLAHMVSEQALSLTVFKPLDVTNLKSKSMKFFISCFNELFSQCHPNQIQAIFSALSGMTQQDGRQELISSFKAFFTLYKDIILGSKALSEDMKQKLEQGIELATKSLRSKSIY